MTVSSSNGVKPVIGNEKPTGFTRCDSDKLTKLNDRIAIMNLREFISQSMLEIVQGIRDSQQEARKLLAEVNPLLSKGDIPNSRTDIAPPGIGQVGYAPHTLFIEFDVAVLATTDSKNKGGFGLFVAGFGAGAVSESTNANTTHSRIKFTLPLSLRAVNEYVDKLREAETK